MLFYHIIVHVFIGFMWLKTLMVIKVYIDVQLGKLVIVQMITIESRR